MSIIKTSLTTLAVAGALAGSAVAQSGPVVSSAGPDDQRPVSVDVQILGADGSVVEHRSCHWDAEPSDADMKCVRFESDPQVAVAEIEAAGGASAVVHTVSDGVDTTTNVSTRSDRTWLFRSVGQHLHAGRVCTADGARCARWDAKGAKHASARIRAAAAKLRR